MGTYGRLGYADSTSIGDNEAAHSAGTVRVLSAAEAAAGGTVADISVGTFHTCVLLSTGRVRCWGRADSGRLGYGNLEHIGDDEHPHMAGDVPILSDPERTLGVVLTALSVGRDHSCALTSTGAARCWGYAGFGRLGYGHTTDIGDDEPAHFAGDVRVLSVAEQLAGLQVAAVSAGSAHTCALLLYGAVRCWGHGQNGRLGYGNQMDVGDDEEPHVVGNVSVLAPSELAAGLVVDSVAAGDTFTCAQLSTGASRCWGTSDQGRIGYGNREHIGDNELPHTAGDVPLLPAGAGVAGVRINSLATGTFQTCAVLSAGSLRCWGRRYQRLVGMDLGDDEAPAVAGSISLFGPGEAGLSAADLAATGEDHACALTTDGGVRCWGDNLLALGYPGGSSVGDDEEPYTVGDVPVLSAAERASGLKVLQVATGHSHACAVLPSGGVRCWGDGASGRLGYGNMLAVGDDEAPFAAGNVPVLSPSESNWAVTAVTTGSAHTCALLSTGAARCWGSGGQGGLGYGATTAIGDNEEPYTVGDVPVLSGEELANGFSITQLSARGHTCAVISTGAVRCWGSNQYGQLGYGHSEAIGDDEPPAMAGDIRVVSTADVASGVKVVSVSAGTSHTCVLLSTGAARCWGFGGSGRLGYGNTDTVGIAQHPQQAGDVPVLSEEELGLGREVTGISAGAAHTCAVISTGAVRCWGYGGMGRLGYGNPASVVKEPHTAGDAQVLTPTELSLGMAVSKVEAGFSHTCALLSTAAVRCWGGAGLGQPAYGPPSVIGDDETLFSDGDVAVLSPAERRRAPAPPSAPEASGLWLPPTAPEARAGASIARAGDVDGDGCSRDVLIGMPGHDTPSIDGGPATRADSGGLLLRGQSCGSPNASLASLSLLIDGQQLQTAEALPAGSELGSSVAWIGTASPRVGLRRTYIAAGAPGSDAGNGSVLLLLIDHDDGAADGDGWSVKLLSKLSPANASSTAVLQAGSRLGASVVLANAVGQPTATLLIGAPAANGGRGGVLVADVSVSTGQVQSDPTWIADGTGGLPDNILSAGDAFGSAVAWTHFDGIGASDSLQLVVGAPGDDMAGTDSGCVYLLALHAEGRAVATWQRLQLWDVAPGDRFGASLAWLGDVDGDNVFEEVLVGAPGGSSAGVVVTWLRAGVEGADASPRQLQLLDQGATGMPSSLPESFGAAVAAVGDWNDDRVASDVLIGAPLADSGEPSVLHVRFSTVGSGGAPWSEGTPFVVTSVSPRHALPFDQPTLIRINGTALYEWDPLAQNSRLAHPPEVLISGLDPRGCEVEEVSFDGQTFTCWLSPSLEPNRTLSVKVGSEVSQGFDVSYHIRGSVQAVDDQSPLLQSGGEARTFTGFGLIRADSLSVGELQAAGVGQLLIGSEYTCPVTSMMYSSDGSWVQCVSMPAGVGGPHPVRLQLPGGIESNSGVTVSYEAAVVSSIEPSMVQLTALSLLNFTISGSSFGHSLADTPRVVIGGNDCLDTEWHSSTELFCAAVVGNFTDHDVVVYTGTSMYPSTGGNARLDYLESPQVVAALPPEVSTRGGDNITCIGISFADQEHIIDQVLVGDAPCSHWDVTDASSNSMTCTTPPGTGRDKRITIVTKFGIQTLSVVPAVSYLAPELVSSEPAVAYADEAFAYDFDIAGTGFGVHTGDASTVEWINVAGKVCPTVDHVSDSVVRCVGIHPPWDGERVVQVSVAGQVSEAKALIEFQDPPVVTSIDPSTLSTAGGEITVHGTGFGGSASEVEAVLVGGRRCSNLHDHSSTEVECTVSAGTGISLNVSIVVQNNGASEPRPLFSYEPPSVEALAVLRSDDQLEDYTFAGLESVDLAVSVEDAGTRVSGATLTLLSDNAWSQTCPLLVRAGGAANETDGIDQLRQLECIGLSLATVPEAGGTLRAVLEVGGQSSTESSSSIDVVGRPAVSLVTPSTGISTHGAGNTSHAPVQVLGTNLGRKPSDVLSVSVGGVGCPLVEWKQPDGESPQLLVAIPPGVGAAVALSVTTRGGLSDASRTVGYQPAEVASIEPTYALTGTGTAAFNITGQHFGNRPSDLDRIQVGEQECSHIEWVSSTRVVCHAVSRSRWESRSVTVTVGGQEGLKNSYFEAVGDPVIEVVSPAVADIDEEVLVLGKAFGQQASDIVNVTVLGEPCSKVVHRGSTALSCTLPQPPADVRQAAVTNPRLLRDVPLVVWNAAGKQSIAANVSYSGSGNPLTEAPSHLLAWRPVGQPRQFTVRWAFPTDEQMEGVDDVESFTIELSQLAGNATPQEISVRVEQQGDEAGPVTTSDNMRVFRHDDFVFTESTVSIRIRAVNPTGDGPWSVATPPVPATCTGGRWLAETPAGSSEERYLNETLAADEVPTAVDLRLWGDPAAMERCEEGYHGTMCTSCQPGYTRWNGFSCRKCRPMAMVYLAMGGLLLLMFVIISYLIVSAIKSGAEKTPVGTAAIKVAFSHIQTVAIAASFNLEWPDSVLSLFAGMSTATSVSSEVLSLDCALPSTDSNEASASGGQSRFFAKAGIVLAMPLLMLVVAAVAWSVGAWCTSCCERPSTSGQGDSALATVNNPMHQRQRGRFRVDRAPPTPVKKGGGLTGFVQRKLSISHLSIGVKLSAWDKFLTSAVVMLFLVHMSVTTTSLQLLTCRDIASTEDPGAESPVLDGDLAPAAAAGLASATSGGCGADQTHRRLVQDLEVCCYDRHAQRSMYGLGIPGMLVYAFGIPISAALLLWWRRDSLQTHHTKTTLGFLYAGFQDEAYYWESVVMLRKVLVAVIAVSLEPMGVTLQTYTALVVIFSLALLHARVWPYSSHVLNRLELGALITAFVTFECGLFLTDPATSQSMRLLAQLAIFLANIAFVLAAMAVILWDKLGVNAWRRRLQQPSRGARGGGLALERQP